MLPFKLYLCSMQLSLQHRLTGHQGSIYALEQGGVAGTFFSGGGDRIVAEWAPEKGQDGLVVARATDAVYALCYLPASRRLLVGQGSGAIHVIDLDTNREIRLIQLGSSAIFTLRKHPTEQAVLVLSADGVLSVLEEQSLELIRQIRLSGKKLRSLVIDAERKRMLVGCGDGSVAVLSSEDWSLLHRFQAHAQDFSVNALCFSPDGNYILSGSRDAHLKVFSTEDFSEVHVIPAHNYAIYDIRFSPDGTYFATASRDKTVKIWAYEDMKVLRRLEGNDGKGHVNSVNKLLWLDDGTLLSAGDDRAIQCWK